MTDDLLKLVEGDAKFVTSHASKQDRERWIVTRWLAAEGRSDVFIESGEDPPDFVVADRSVEVVEVLEFAGAPRRTRRRGDEYKERRTLAEEGVIAIRRLPSLGEVRRGGHLWILHEIRKKAEKYDAVRAANWTLLVYANFSWTDYIQWDRLSSQVAQIPPPFLAVDVVFDETGGPKVCRVFERPG